MSWMIHAGLAYVIMAGSQLVDKAFLQVVFRDAKAYAALVGLLGSLAFILLPFGVTILPLPLLLVACLGGALFIAAVWVFLSALQGDDASRIIPLLGSLIPLGTLFGETVFLGARFSATGYLAIGLLIVGALTLTLTKSESPRRSNSAIMLTIGAAALFATSFVTTKYIYNQIDFVSGFFWMRMGGILFAVVLVGFSQTRADLRHFFLTKSFPLKVGYFLNQAFAGGGFFLQSYAISLASVSLVTALQGIQYVFVLLFIFIGSRIQPDLLGEKLTKRLLLEKLTSVALIAAGIALLAVARS